MELGGFYLEDEDYLTALLSGDFPLAVEEAGASRNGAPGVITDPGSVLESLFESGTFAMTGAASSRKRLNEAIQEVIDARPNAMSEVDIGAILYDLDRGNSKTSDADTLFYDDYPDLLRGPADTSRGDQYLVAVKEYPPLMYLMATNQLKILNNASASQLIRLTTPEPFTAGNPWCPWMAERFSADTRTIPWIFKSLDSRLITTPSPGVVYGNSFLHEVQRQAFHTPRRLRIFMDAFIDLAERLPYLIFTESRFAIWTEWFAKTLIEHKGKSFLDRSTDMMGQEGLARMVSYAITWLSKLAKTATYSRIAYIEGIKMAGNDPRLTPSLAGNSIPGHEPLLFMVMLFAHAKLFNLVHRSLSYRERDKLDLHGDTVPIKLATFATALARTPRSPRKIITAYNDMILTVNTDLVSRPQPLD